jgi:hypothetical protein
MANFRVLGVADLAAVQAAIWEVRAKWYNIGLELGVLAGTLDNIKKRNGNDGDSCLREMLEEWLTSTSLSTWGGLSLALRAVTVNEGALANRLQ